MLQFAQIHLRGIHLSLPANYYQRKTLPSIKTLRTLTYIFQGILSRIDALRRTTTLIHYAAPRQGTTVMSFSTSPSARRTQNAFGVQVRTLITRFSKSKAWRLP